MTEETQVTSPPQDPGHRRARRAADRGDRGHEGQDLYDEARSNESEYRETRYDEARYREAQNREAQQREAQYREAQQREAQNREAQNREAQNRQAAYEDRRRRTRPGGYEPTGPDQPPRRDRTDRRPDQAPPMRAGRHSRPSDQDPAWRPPGADPASRPGDPAADHYGRTADRPAAGARRPAPGNRDGYPAGREDQRPPEPPGRPAGYTRRDRAGGDDQFLSDSWFRPESGRPPRSSDEQPGYERTRRQRPAAPERPLGYPRPPAGQDRGGDSGYPSRTQPVRGNPDRDYRRLGGRPQDAGQAGLPGQHGAYGFTGALGNYRTTADGELEPPAARARDEDGYWAYRDRAEPVVYTDEQLTQSPDWPRQPRYEPTRRLELPDVLPAAGGAVDPSDTGQFTAIRQSSSSSVLRSSGVMAVGTLGSRITGFLRTIAQSYALGIAGVAGAYNLSNTLPNVVYNLALGGILTSVIVPLIVNAKKRDKDSGRAYEQRMFTMITAALLAVTVVATLATVPIVHAYSDGSVTGATERLTVTFAYFFIPQIFFYGVSSLIGAVLNTRGSFAAPMWTPILNNVVVIAMLGLYVAVAGLHKNPASITPGQVRLLGLGTTLGVVVQTVALVPALRKVGFRWQPRTDFRRGEVGEIGRMAGWMFCYIGATQIAFLITTKVAEVVPQSAGVTEYNYAWLLFQLPYAVVGISVITALLPRMSAHASAGQLSLVRTDFSSGIRLAATIVVPCSLVLAVLGPAVTRVFLAHGAAGTAEAHTTGVVFAVFCLGLLPYMIFQLQLRVFYSLHDSKTPALIGLATMTVNIVTNLLALAFLRHSPDLVAGLGLGFGLANVLGAMVAGRILSIRMRGLDGYAVGRTLARMHVATLPAALIAFLVDRVIGTGSFLAAAATLFLGGGGALVAYVLTARLLHIRELDTVSRTVMSRLGR
jgi:putative peptidoglycan lipid II flippase